MKRTILILSAIVLTNFTYTHTGTIKADADQPGENKKDSYLQDSRSGKGKVVGLDNYYNNEWKKDKSGKMVPFHYVWEDKDASGFSDLKGVIENLGAGTATLNKAPTVKDLNKFSIYFIVDPDTPKETEKPNYIQDDAIRQIVTWVKKGGVLVLFGNDMGNAEFEHWNRLASNFGIEFLEDSENKVIGKHWDMGKYDNFPDHPLFKDIKKIYLKEVSTLQIKSPAIPVLTCNNSVIMASVKFGKGFVFAVGDPWIYNEYIGHSRLPEDFQNYEAAVNLFDWLLRMAPAVK